MRETASELELLCRQKEEFESQLQASQEQVLKLDSQKLADGQALQEKQEMVCKLRCLVMGHMDLMKRSLQQLRGRVQEEQRTFLGDMQSWDWQWRWVCRQDQANMTPNQNLVKEACENRDRMNESFAAKLQELGQMVSHLNSRIKQTSEILSVQKQSVETLRTESQRGAINSERLVFCLSTALPEGFSD